MKYLVSFFAVTLLWAGPAQADPTKGEVLFKYCRSGKETADRVYKNGELFSSPGNLRGTKKGIYCIGYIQAVEDDLMEKGEICHSKYSAKASFKAILNYFETHPELAKDNARIAVTAALKETHRCQ
ncbi:Rap1a/Tai family immunity protein [Kiloniella sp.]|uniref:Rap1a/Tai family immunity protein n=1 Tax=Kiloniella sp. TaxID=1938587 RepID=UPI003B02E239